VIYGSEFARRPLAQGQKVSVLRAFMQAGLGNTTNRFRMPRSSTRRSRTRPPPRMA